MRYPAKRIMWILGVMMISAYHMTHPATGAAQGAETITLIAPQASAGPTVKQTVDSTIERFAPLVPATTLDGGQCRPPMYSPNPVAPQSISVLLFSDSSAGPAREITVSYDAHGTLLRFSDVRGPRPLSFRGDGSPSQPGDGYGILQSAGPRSIILLDFRTDRGTAGNEEETEHSLFIGKSSRMRNLASLDHPDQIIAYVEKACGKPPLPTPNR